MRIIAGTTPAVAAAVDLGTDARREGRWGIVEANPDLTTQAAVNSSAPRSLDRHAALAPSWEVDLDPAVWTPDDLWVGDLSRLVVNSLRLNTDTVERVHEVTVTDDGNGTPTPTLRLSQGELARNLDALLRRLPARLTQLARR